MPCETVMKLSVEMDDDEGMSKGPCRLVVLTGGPGAGKTAVLEVIRRNFGARVQVLPEAASILLRGGFPRGTSHAERRAVQRAIFHVQRELERLAVAHNHGTVALCDRGTLDAVAYWPGEPAEFFQEVGVTRESELARYAAVIHLRTPKDGQGYDHSNPVRIEDAEEAALIDEAIHHAWEGHPHRHTVDSTPDFLDKVVRVLALVAAELPQGTLTNEPVPGITRDA
jgi:predicted ATPase